MPEETTRFSPCVDTQRLGTLKAEPVPQPTQLVRLNDVPVKFDIDTGAADNFICKEQWKELGRPALETVTTTYESASCHHLATLGSFRTQASTSKSHHPSLRFVVADVPSLNLLGRDGIRSLQISVDEAMAATA